MPLASVLKNDRQIRQTSESQGIRFAQLALAAVLTLPLLFLGGELHASSKTSRHIDDRLSKVSLSAADGAHLGSSLIVGGAPKTKVTEFSVEEVGGDSAVISWKTESATGSSLLISVGTPVGISGVDEQEIQVLAHDGLRTRHRVRVNGLKPATLYKVAVAGEDGTSKGFTLISTAP